MIRITNLVKNHGPLRVLDGVSLTFPASQVAVIVGPSGSGKSTLLRCINGLEPFQEGGIEVGDKLKITGGHAPQRATLLELRRTVGMVFQQFNLFPHFTALQNVMSGPIHVLGWSKDKAEAAAKPLLAKVGLADKADSRPSQLSGGQQQRVAIARALAVNPAAILFDEPTSALDPKMTAEVLGVMKSLADEGQTMIIVSHDLTSVAKIARTVHVLDNGKVAYSGPIEEAKMISPSHEGS